jgi:hypothetical protein
MISQQTKVIGTKTREAIEAAWLADFRGTEDRPAGKGWMTVTEMAAAAGSGKTKMATFINRKPAGYWETQRGFVKGATGARRTAMFYRKISVTAP